MAEGKGGHLEGEKKRKEEEEAAEERSHYKECTKSVVGESKRTGQCEE